MVGLARRRFRDSSAITQLLATGAVADAEMMELEEAADTEEAELVTEKLVGLKAKLAASKDEASRALLLAGYAADMDFETVRL